jgi:small subunit ribosomal protein S2
MVSDKAFAQEYADVTPAGLEPHQLATDEDDTALNEIQISAGVAADSVEDTEDDETIDLNAALGGGIRKAPAAETEPEPDTAPVEATA